MKAKYSIGIGLNLFDARGILLREDGKVITKIEKARKNVSANETIKILLELFEGIISKARKYKDSITAIGLAMGGIVDSKKGVVYWPQEQNSSYVYIALPLKDYLEKKFGLPVVVENDTNACVWAEHVINFPKYKNLIYMFSGVGCGIIIDGKLYRGKDGGAGELFLNPKGTMCSSLGEFSFLKQWPVDLGMTKRAKELISMGRKSSLIKKITSTGELSVTDIFKEAKKKDKVSKEVVEEASICLGAKIAFLVNLLNPEQIILGGGLEEEGDVLLEKCARIINGFSFSEMKRNLKVSLSGLGKEAASLGAAFLAG